MTAFSDQGRQDAAADGSPAGKVPRISVVYATRGRAEILGFVVEMLRRQTRQPDEIIVSAVSAEDVGGLRWDRRVTCLLGSQGLPKQRNAALRHIGSSSDIIVFFDDDFIAHPRWLEAVERCFAERPSVAAITGHVIADGVCGPGLSIEQAMEKIEGDPQGSGPLIREGYSPYGCNMAFRASAIEGLFFDERLVLYGWLEDRDFGGALGKRGGKAIKLRTAIGVHLGIKTGRVSGRRLGYSQIVNPFYLHRKGTMTTASLVEHLFRNITSNLLRSPMPERYVDRFGRLRGNIRGVRDLLTGVLAPERAELL